MAVRVSLVADALSEIKKTLVMSEEVVNGVHTCANFEISGCEYLLNCKPTLYRVIRDMDGSVTYAPKYLTWVRAGKYPAWRLKMFSERTEHREEVYPMAYVLTLCCLVDGVLDAYLANDKLSINHKVVCRGSGRGVTPYKPLAANPFYLELVSQSLNVKHGRLVDKLGLCGVSISANDIEQLSDILVKYPRGDWASIIRDYYSDSSIDPVIDEDLLLKG